MLWYEITLDVHYLQNSLNFLVQLQIQQSLINGIYSLHFLCYFALVLVRIIVTTKIKHEFLILKNVAIPKLHFQEKNNSVNLNYSQSRHGFSNSFSVHCRTELCFAIRRHLFRNHHFKDNMNTLVDSSNFFFLPTYPVLAIISVAASRSSGFCLRRRYALVQSRRTDTCVRKRFAVRKVVK